MTNNNDKLNCLQKNPPCTPLYKGGEVVAEKPSELLIWMDLEMTGLRPETDRILEMAAIITDSELNIIAESPVFILHQSQTCLDAMDDWNQKHHGNSGLITRVQASVLNEKMAEKQMLDFIQCHVPESRQSPLCGNSIYQDRRFLYQYMPALEAHFHYRNIDVSTIKELARRWNPGVYESFKKASTHRALDDIRESIGELRHYRAAFF